MQLILLERVENLGDLGDLVQVKSGYARNYLVPAGKAKPATPANIAEFEERRAELQKIAEQALKMAFEEAERSEKYERVLAAYNEAREEREEEVTTAALAY